ncbi:MAG: hypothetical protein KDL31_07205, partial [Kiritimatiellae bacterium]|nr:hypothetical protein [Kiritimatiellia bacterium]
MHRKSEILATLDDGRQLTVPAGTPVMDLLPGATDEHGRHYLGALVNNMVATLEFLLEVDSEIKFLTFADPPGWRIYRNTANYLLAKVVQEV